MPSNTPSSRINKLEKAALKAGLARVREHIEQHGQYPNMSGHTIKARSMYEAFVALLKAKK